MNITHLRCEYAEHPLGIDVPRPRFSWQWQTDRPGARQSAYQILATSGGETLWDTGRVETDQSIHIEYSGPPLQSAQRVEWQVRGWDETGQPTAWSAPAWFEMGLLKPEDWQADWIGSFLTGSARASVPVPYLRKTFHLQKAPVRARLYITALGLCF